MKRIGIVWILLVLAGCMGSGSRKDRAIDHYVTAISLHEGQFDEEAASELEQAVRYDGEFSLAYSMLGGIYRQQKQYDKSAGAYENACRLDPWAFEDHLNLGQVYQILERYIDSIRVLKQAVQIQPDSAPAHYSLGVSYYKTDDYENAAEHCKKAADLDPNNVEILASLGDVYGKRQDDYQAVNSYKQALDLNPDQPEIMTKLGLTYTRQKRFDPARMILEKAIQADPAAVKPHIALGYTSLVEGKLTYTQAKEEMKNSQATASLRMQLADRQFQEALEQYRQASQLEPSNTDAQNGMGVTCMMLFLKDPQNTQMGRDALACWHRSLELNPNQPKIKALVEKYNDKLFKTSSDLP